MVLISSFHHSHQYSFNPQIILCKYLSIIKTILNYSKHI